MRKTILHLGLFLLCGGVFRGATAHGAISVSQALPPREVEILRRVGEEYGLGADTLRLLLVIRKIENGGPGVEMGVASDFPSHRSHRYAGDADRSLRLQARWAAGTILKHYTGDLDAFAKRYCPPKWSHWSSMARHWMNRG